MIDLTTPIVPYEGTGIFKLNETYADVCTKLKTFKILYKEKVLEVADEDFEEWKIVDILKRGHKYEVMQLFFAKDKLLKIVLWEDFKGSLPNGIHTGMNLLEAKKIDSKLERDDEFDELFESPDGYSIEYSNGTGKIINISIFVSEW